MSNGSIVPRTARQAQHSPEHMLFNQLLRIAAAAQRAAMDSILENEDWQLTDAKHIERVRSAIDLASFLIAHKDVIEIRFAEPVGGGGGGGGPEEADALTGTYPVWSAYWHAPYAYTFRCDGKAIEYIERLSEDRYRLHFEDGGGWKTVIGDLLLDWTHTGEYIQPPACIVEWDDVYTITEKGRAALETGGGGGGTGVEDIPPRPSWPAEPFTARQFSEYVEAVARWEHQYGEKRHAEPLAPAAAVDESDETNPFDVTLTELQIKALEFARGRLPHWFNYDDRDRMYTAWPDTVSALEAAFEQIRILEARIEVLKDARRAVRDDDSDTERR